MKETLVSQIPFVGPARSLTGWATEALRQAILNGHLKAGDRLDQDAIAAELEVSRTPLREAIAALEAEGLLESEPHRGVFVAKVSDTEIREIFAVRAVLEAEVARQVANSIPDDVLDQLEMMLREAQQAYDAGDHVAQFEADSCFHETLCEFCENRLLAEVLQGVNNRINLVRRFAQTRPGPHIDRFAQEHRAILGALQRRDGLQAAELMKKHLQRSEVRVQKLVDREED